MTNLQQQRVSEFQTLNSTPSQAVLLSEIYRLIRHDDFVRFQTQSYRKTRKAMGKKKANETVKEKLMPAFSVAVLFDGYGRGATNVLGYTGLALCDIDNIPEESLEEAFQKVQADPHTLLAYHTISGLGLRIVYMYARETLGDQGRPQAYPAAFLKGNKHYAELTGFDFDAACSDYGRLSTLSHDELAFMNLQAKPFIITDEEVLTVSFSGQHGRGKPRSTDPTGSHHASIEQAWTKVEKTLDGWGLVYQPTKHHDYVMHASFMMNRFGVDLDELLQWAAINWADYNAREREATIRSCYRKTEEHGTWRLEMRGRKAKETAMITLPEIREWLHQHVEVIYNQITDQTMYRVTAASTGQEEWELLDERVVCSIRSQMAKDTGKRVLKADVKDVLRSDYARLFHPVREYIEALPQWDGKDRVAELCKHVKEDKKAPGDPPSAPEGATIPLQDVHKAHEAPSGAVGGAPGASGSFSWALHKWLVAMVATWMSDHATNHQIFVLIGPQGIYKTTFFRHLLPPQLRSYFWENAHNSFASKDDHLALSENCLVEIEEIDMQNPRDISELKALATSEKVKERRPYALFREEKHRLASFCGSGNQQHFLSDDTGNRRWLCFLVSQIDDPRQWNLDYDQLYAQLRDELRAGFQYWFDVREQRIVEKLNQAFRIESDEEQLIRSRLRPPHRGDKITLMNAASICQYINGGIVGRGLSTRKVGLVMTRMGFEKIHTRAGHFYKVYQIPANEIQPTLAMIDDEILDNQANKQIESEGSLPF